MYEQQYIEYNAPADTVKTILDKSEQVVRINGEVLNYQAAREKYGVVIPKVEKVEVPEDPEDAHYYSYDEPDYLTVDEKVYTDVTMNQDLSLAVRKTGIGEYYGQAYYYTTPFGQFTGKGYVDIVATQAALNVGTGMTMLRLTTTLHSKRMATTSIAAPQLRLRSSRMLITRHS